jgi:hypothetical protein
VAGSPVRRAVAQRVSARTAHPLPHIARPNGIKGWSGAAAAQPPGSPPSWSPAYHPRGHRQATRPTVQPGTYLFGNSVILVHDGRRDPTTVRQLLALLGSPLPNGPVLIPATNAASAIGSSPSRCGRPRPAKTSAGVLIGRKQRAQLSRVSARQVDGVVDPVETKPDRLFSSLTIDVVNQSLDYLPRHDPTPPHTKWFPERLPRSPGLNRHTAASAAIPGVETAASARPWTAIAFTHNTRGSHQRQTLRAASRVQSFAHRFLCR